MSSLTKALISQDAIITITGPIGVGKTTIVNRTVEACASNRVVARVGRLQLGPDQILELLLTEFGVTDQPSGTIQRYGAFKRLLNEWADSGTRVFIIVEDAIHIGVDALLELEAMTAADSGDSPGASILLMGSAELDKHLEAPELARLQQRLRRRVTVEPFSPAEIAAYLEHCFRVAGKNLGDVVERGTAEMLYRLSEGMPRVVNNVFETALIAAAETQMDRITPKFVENVALQVFGVEPKLPPLGSAAASAAAAEAEPTASPAADESAKPAASVTVAAEPDKPVEDSAQDEASEPKESAPVSETAAKKEAPVPPAAGTSLTARHGLVVESGFEPNVEHASNSKQRKQLEDEKQALEQKAEQQDESQPDKQAEEAENRLPASDETQPEMQEHAVGTEAPATAAEPESATAAPEADAEPELATAAPEADAEPEQAAAEAPEDMDKGTESTSEKESDDSAGRKYDPSSYADVAPAKVPAANEELSPVPEAMVATAGGSAAVDHFDPRNHVAAAEEIPALSPSTPADKDNASPESSVTALDTEAFAAPAATSVTADPPQAAPMPPVALPEQVTTDSGSALDVDPSLLADLEQITPQATTDEQPQAATEPQAEEPAEAIEEFEPLVPDTEALDAALAANSAAEPAEIDPLMPDTEALDAALAATQPPSPQELAAAEIVDKALDEGALPDFILDDELEVQRSPPQDMEMETLAEELGDATLLEELSDVMAETLFGNNELADISTEIVTDAKAGRRAGEREVESPVKLDIPELLDAEVALSDPSPNLDGLSAVEMVEPLEEKKPFPSSAARILPPEDKPAPPAATDEPPRKARPLPPASSGMPPTKTKPAAPSATAMPPQTAKPAAPSATAMPPQMPKPAAPSATGIPPQVAKPAAPLSEMNPAPAVHDIRAPEKKPPAPAVSGVPYKADNMPRPGLPIPDETVVDLMKALAEEANAAKSAKKVSIEDQMDYEITASQKTLTNEQIAKMRKTEQDASDAPKKKSGLFGLFKRSKD